METTKNYTPDGGAITEMICSGLAILLIFISWLTLSASGKAGTLDVPSVYERIQHNGGPGAYIFIGLCLFNIVLKFFSRSAWLSTLCAFFFGALIVQEFREMQVVNSSNFLGAHISISIGGFCAIIVELVLVVSTIVALFQWIAVCTRETAKKLLIAALIGLASCGIGFFLIMKAAGSGNNALVVFSGALTTIGLITFVLCGLLGTIIWVRNKQEDTSDIDKDNEEPIVGEEESSDKKWYYVAGGVLVMALIVGGIMLLQSSKEGSNKENAEIQAGSDSEMNILADENAGNEATVLSGFDFVVGRGEYGLELFAKTNDGNVATGISGTAEKLDIIHQYDFDGDGEKEALVYEWGGGNADYPPYIVYYDKDSKSFKKAEGFETIFGENDVEFESWKGKQSILVKAGIETSRYIFENRQIKKVESKTADVGAELMTYTCEGLFGNSSEENSSVSFDLNGDGLNEKLIFKHDDSPAFSDGKAMMLEKIIWANESETFGCHQTASTFTFLESMTSGVRNMVTDGRQLHKWTGEEYDD